jgi:hypothetical protein
LSCLQLSLFSFPPCPLLCLCPLTCSWQVWETAQFSNLSHVLFIIGSLHPAASKASSCLMWILGAKATSCPLQKRLMPANCIHSRRLKNMIFDLQKLRKNTILSSRCNKKKVKQSAFKTKGG